MVASWEDMKKILVCFIWLDITNDVDGLRMWEELEALRKIYSLGECCHIWQLARETVGTAHLTLPCQSIGRADWKDDVMYIGAMKSKSAPCSFRLSQCVK